MPSSPCLIANLSLSTVFNFFFSICGTFLSLISAIRTDEKLCHHSILPTPPLHKSCNFSAPVPHLAEHFSVSLQLARKQYVFNWCIDICVLTRLCFLESIICEGETDPFKIRLLHLSDSKWNTQCEWRETNKLLLKITAVGDDRQIFAFSPMALFQFYGKHVFNFEMNFRGISSRYSLLPAQRIQSVRYNVLWKADMQTCSSRNRGRYEKQIFIKSLFYSFLLCLCHQCISE